MAWLDKIPFTILLVIAVVMAAMPIVPQPHLWEKLVMLQQAELTKPLDIFDLIMHGLGLVLVVVKGIRIMRQRSA